MIDHGALTDRMIETLAQATEERVGDGVAPADGGWLAGQPNVGVFVPYLVLVDGGMIPRNDVMCDNPDWLATWSVRYFGGSRSQCDWIASKGRNALPSLDRMTFGGLDVYQVQSRDLVSIGAVTRVDQVDPPYWQCFDTVQLLCSPRRAVRKSAVPSEYYTSAQGVSA